MVCTCETIPVFLKESVGTDFYKKPSDTDRVLIDLVISVSESDLSLSLPLIHLSMSPAHWDQSQRGLMCNVDFRKLTKQTCHLLQKSIHDEDRYNKLSVPQ